jgi:mono/diheme cytochrome c family protein
MLPLLDLEAHVPRSTLVLPALLFLGCTLSAQQTPPVAKTPAEPSIPVDAAKQPNPVKPSPESLARAKKWWGLDCAMCHGSNGDGKGDTATDMKLKMLDFTDPATLKDRTDGELFYIIKNGNEDMPPEGSRVKVQENWDLVNYVRWLAKKKPGGESKPQ